MSNNINSLRSRMSGMAVGETLVVPLGTYSWTTVRSYASDLGWVLERKYSVHRDRDARTYNVTRES